MQMQIGNVLFACMQMQTLIPEVADNRGNLVEAEGTAS